MNAAISAVNVSETIKVLQKHGMESETAMHLIADVVSEIVPFDEQQALTTAVLDKRTSKLGLSLRDRACLSLAHHLDLQAVTADKTWSKLKIDIPILVIC